MTTLQASTKAFLASKLACALLLLWAALSIAAFAQTFSSLASFNQTNGANPYGTIVQGEDGNFYGTTQFGGTYGQGTVFKITPEGTVTNLYSFCSQYPNCTDGGQPFSGLVLASNGNFYGTTLGTAFTITPSGDLTTIYRFCSLADCADGSSSYASLIQASDGSFYGTTAYGGAKGSCGTVFKLTPHGVLTTLQKFRLIDGCFPFSPLVQAPDGNFYGTTSSGGAHNFGTIFRLTPAGLFTLLHSFDDTHGSHPRGPLLPASDGNLYGTTEQGGAFGYGTIFSLTAAGKIRVLRSFDYTDGATPYAGLVQDASGNFYGTTYTGVGQSNCLLGSCGSVFKLSPAGKLSTIYAFCSQSACTDGAGPYADVLLAADGNLYGTTVIGGTNACGADGTCGTIFKVSLEGGSR